MQVRKIALSAAALALPLTALGAAPAHAGYDHRGTPGPSIYIKDVNAKVVKKIVVHKYEDYKKIVIKTHRPDPVVKVGYKCFTKQDKYKPGTEVENGEIKAVLKQKKAKRYGSAEAVCDGTYRKARVVLEDGWGKLKPGHAWVAVKITDPQDKSAYDAEKTHVDLVVKKKVIIHEDDEKVVKH
jgi:hypothetical protein